MYCYATMGQFRNVASSGHTISSSVVTLSLMVSIIWNASTCAFVADSYIPLQNFFLHVYADSVTYLFPLEYD